MSLKFDAVIKELATAAPEAFVEIIAHVRGEPVQTLNVDLSTVSTSADLAFGVGEPLRAVVHIDAQTGPDADLPRSVLVYKYPSAQAHRRSCPEHRPALAAQGAALELEGVTLMHESSSYQLILDEGELRHGRKVVLRFGEKRLGPPKDSVRAAIVAIEDLDRLDAMLETAVTAANWDEILAGEGSGSDTHA